MMAGMTAAGVPARGDEAPQAPPGRALEVEVSAAGDRVTLELDRGRCYHVLAAEAAREELVRHLVEASHVAVVAPGGGLIGNLAIWENLSLPVSWRARAPRPSLAAEASALFGEIGFDAQRFSVLCMEMPEALSAFEAKAVSFVRAMLLEPEILVYDRLFEGLGPVETARALRFHQLFSVRLPFRTSVFMESEASLPAALPAWRAYDLRGQP
jgi:hypothetical protein